MFRFRSKAAAPPPPPAPAARPEVLGFLQAIKEQPEDDVPRLVLADWLEEHGDPRGELVRLQVMLAHVIPGSQAGQARQRREQELRRLYERDWLGPLAGLARSWTCQRGLVQMTLVASTFLGEFARPAETEATAWVDGVRLMVAMPELVVQLAGSPLLARLNLLNLGGQPVSDGAVRALAGSPYAANLTSLELYGSEVGSEGALALAVSPHLGKLRHLDLDGCRVGHEGALSLAESRSLASLETLQLRGNRLGGATVSALRRRKGLRLVV